MNSRQRRGIPLLALSLLCAIAAFAGVVTVVGNVEAQVGPKAAAYRLTRDVPADQPISAADLQRTGIPRRWLPSTAVTHLSQLDGKIAATTLTAGSLLQTDMLGDRPRLEPGQLEIAIMIDAETGVAGQITPSARVDIFATFAAQNGSGNGQDESKIIVQDAQVLNVGQIRAFDGADQADGQTREVPITFALAPADAQRVAYAESFAKHLRLALVAPGDTGQIPPGQQTYTLAGGQ